MLILGAIITGPTGEPETFADRFRDGNRWVEIQVSHQELGVENAFVSVDGNDMPAACTAAYTLEETAVTNPDTLRISLEAESFIECLATAEDGGSLYVNASELDRNGLLYMEIYPPDAVPFEVPAAAFGLIEIDALRGKHDLTVDLFDPFAPDGGPVGSAQVVMNVTVTDRTSSRVLLQNISVKEVLTELEAEGAVIVGDTVFVLDGTCSGDHFSAKGVNTSPNGPQPKGKPPANDTPEGAEPLPTREITSTRGTALEPEVPWLEEFDGMLFEFPMGKTLWYQVTGTGEEVLIDTAGSDFDTSIAVYAGPAFEQVVLADDGAGEIFSFQASLSFLAEEGTTYDIQIGGFAGEYGQLVLRSG